MDQFTITVTRPLNSLDRNENDKNRNTRPVLLLSQVNGTTQGNQHI